MKRYSYLLLFGLQCAWVGCDSSSTTINQPPVNVPPVVSEIPPLPLPGDQPAKGDQTPPTGDQPPTTGEAPPTGEGPPTSNQPPKDTLVLQAGMKVDRGQYLLNIGNGVSGLTTGFQAATEKLATGVKQYCASRDTASLAALRAQYSEAMFIWQKLELFQIGPLAENNRAIKNRIYGWPVLANYCKIDEELLLAREDPSIYELPPNANRKGLQALEYLIFDSSLTTICPNGPVKTEWQGLSVTQKWDARCAYMNPVASELVANAGDLVSRWGVADNNVVTRRLGDPASEQALLQELFSNLSYIDLEVKNQKLAAPAGQDIKYCNKTPSPCLDKEELRYSHLSKAALAANFRALADIVFGFGEPRGGGLSALVRHEGGTAVADRSEAKITALVRGSESQTERLDVLVAAKANEDCETSQVSWLCQVRQSIRSVIGDFKGEYAAVLKTTFPVPPQGDND